MDVHIADTNNRHAHGQQCSAHTLNADWIFTQAINMLCVSGLCEKKTEEKGDEESPAF